MTAREQLIAYLATLFTLAVVFIAALIASGHGVEGATIGQAFGLGTITGGLIGVLRIPTARSSPSEPQAVTVTNTPIDPVPTTPVEDPAP